MDFYAVLDQVLALLRSRGRVTYGALKRQFNLDDAFLARRGVCPVWTASYEERPPAAGLVKGWLVFANGAQLDFKELLLTQPTLRVIKYGYHYRAESRLIFRYDNTNDPAARHLPTFPHHKHTPSGLLAAD
jgi:hypothetical protein